MRAWNNAAPVDVPTVRPVQRGIDLTDWGIPKDRADVDHDPLRPDWEEPTPLGMVMRLTRRQREKRVERLVEMAHARLAEAISVLGEGKQIKAICGLFSGGKDSSTVIHLFRPQLTHLVHANTETGIEATRVFVRQVAADWDIPLIEERPNPGEGYFDLVLGKVRTKDGLRQPYPGGFPGPAMHGQMYQRLKERGLERVKHRLGVANSRTDRVVFIAGRRRAESKTRSTVPHYENWGSVDWSSPIAVWHKADLLTYRLMHAGDIPLNPVSDVLDMSGECGCLANAAGDERQKWIDAYPDDPFIVRVQEVERELADRDDIPEHRKRWGWGGLHDDGSPRTEAGKLCGPDCGRDPLLNLMDPMFHLDGGT